MILGLGLGLARIKNTLGGDTPSGEAPTITSQPTISGTPESGETLTATAGSVTGDPTPTNSFQWQYSFSGVGGWNDIFGANSSTYVISFFDIGYYLRVVQTATNSEGSDTSESLPTPQITSGASGTPPSIDGQPKISGTWTTSGSATATAAPATGDPTPTTSWQWEISDDGFSWSAISGQTSDVITFNSSYSGKYVSVVQTETNTIDGGTYSTSSASQSSPIITQS